MMKQAAFWDFLYYIMSWGFKSPAQHLDEIHYVKPVLITNQ